MFGASSAMASPSPGLSHIFGNSDLQMEIWLWMMEREVLMGHPKSQV